MNGADAAIREIADRQGIGQLLARIAQLADGGDPEDYLDCFTDDAVWDLRQTDDLPLDVQTISGRTSLRRGVLGRREAGIQGPGSHTKHDVSTITVDVAGDQARARSYFRYYRRTDRVPELAAMGSYDDELRRTAAGWRIRMRVIRRD